MPDDNDPKVTNQEPEIVTINKPQKKKSRFNFDKLKNIKFNRNAVLAGSLAAILLVTGLAFFVFNGDNDEPVAENNDQATEVETAAKLGATITFKEGIVEYLNDGNWEKVPEEIAIEDGDSFRTTGATSRAIITLDDGSVIRLDAGTEIKFETLTVNRVVVLQDAGNVYNRIIPSSVRTYIIQTDNAQFQALGTAFKTTSSGDEESVEAYHSKVRETTINKVVEEGQKLTVKNYKDPKKDESIEPIDIEQLKKDAFINWNKEQDLKDEKFKDSLGFLGDFEGPKLTITSPVNGSTVDTVAGSSSGSIVFEGNTEVGVVLTAQSKSQPGSSPIQVDVNTSGNFKTPELTAPTGNSVFEFIAKDKRGNKTVVNVTINIQPKAVSQQQSITLSADSTTIPGKIKFSWALSGMTTPDGVKLVFSETNKSPKFGVDSSEYIASGNSKTMSGFPSGKTYYFGACRYIKATSECDIYSNTVKVVTP